MANLLGSVAAPPRPKTTELDPRVREDDKRDCHVVALLAMTKQENYPLHPCDCFLNKPSVLSVVLWQRLAAATALEKATPNFYNFHGHRFPNAMAPSHMPEKSNYIKKKCSTWNIFWQLFRVVVGFVLQFFCAAV